MDHSLKRKIINQDLTKQEKILRFHIDEFKFILFICSTDFRNYDIEELKGFAEAINRIETLFTQEFLDEASSQLTISKTTTYNIKELKIRLNDYIEGQWYLKMKNETWLEFEPLSSKILKSLNINYIEPQKFMESNMDVDWK